MSETKTCRRCEEELPRSAFHRHGVSSDGLQPWCKECQAAQRREDRRGKYDKGDVLTAEQYMDWKRFTPRERRVAEEASEILLVGGSPMTGFLKSALPETEWRRRVKIAQAAKKLELEERREREEAA